MEEIMNLDLINQIIAFVKAHWVEFLAILGGIDLILGIITKWTPTAWDDNVYAFLHSLISRLLGKGK